MTDRAAASRKFAAALFAVSNRSRIEAPEAEEPPTRSNVVPNEGKTAAAPPRDQMRDFTRDLFGYTD